VNGEMFPPATTADVSLEDKIAELERELARRWHLYPRLVEGATMTQQTADRQILIVQAIVEDLYRHKKSIGENHGKT
jgi:hypothetical protein